MVQEASQKCKNILKFCLLEYLAFSQIWLNLPVEGRHIDNNTKLPKLDQNLRKNRQISFTWFKKLATNVKICFNFVYLTILGFSQIWLNLPVDDRHIDNNTKLTKRKHCEKNCFCWGGGGGRISQYGDEIYKKNPDQTPHQTTPLFFSPK